jgi:hypothetical protein
MVDLQRPIARSETLLAAGFKVIEKIAMVMLRRTPIADKNSSRLIHARILFVRN